MCMHADCGHGIIMATSMAQLHMQVMPNSQGCLQDNQNNVGAETEAQKVHRGVEGRTRGVRERTREWDGSGSH